MNVIQEAIAEETRQSEEDRARRELAEWVEAMRRAIKDADFFLYLTTQPT